ncbi:hypothetical protein ZIOFF_009591 [Zingiber officinale]|uniref:Uncharacterized protein n=1 Tax=Zingiber officinale TaxID=94328 RepID=A0A8J5HHX4_ZINOF|nr:hypothetical protein ZIOFF_009591 [Zingiber officinale]
MDLSMAMWTAVVVGAIAVYWFVWVMGSAEVKGKRAMNLKMGLIMRDKVQDKYKQYLSFFLRSKEGIAAALDDNNCKGRLRLFVPPSLSFLHLPLHRPELDRDGGEALESGEEGPLRQEAVLASG